MCILIFFLSILNLLESKYSNNVIIKEDGDLSELEPFNKQDYINIINYETHSFSRRKKHWDKNEEIDQFKTLDEPQVYLLKSIIKNENGNHSNNRSSVAGINRNPEYNGSVNTQNKSNHKYNLLLQQLAEQNSLEFKTRNIKPTPFKIWIEEYNNNEKKKYVSYIDVVKEVTFPFLRIDDVETVPESITTSYQKQTTRPNLFYLEPLLKIPIDDDGRKIAMAKRNFPGFPVIKWKFKNKQTDKQKLEKTTQLTTNSSKTTEKRTHGTLSTTTIRTETVKSVMDKLNEINLDEKSTEHAVKTTTTRHTSMKQYSDKFCEIENETVYFEKDSTTIKACKNYSGIIRCPNCRKKIKYNMEIIKNIPETNRPTAKYPC